MNHKKEIMFQLGLEKKRLINFKNSLELMHELEDKISEESIYTRETSEKIILHYTNSINKLKTELKEVKQEKLNNNTSILQSQQISCCAVSMFRPAIVGSCSLVGGLAFGVGGAIVGAAVGGCIAAPESIKSSYKKQ